MRRSEHRRTRTYGAHLAACGLLLMAAAGHAAELRVPSQYPSIQDAVNAAQNLDTVLVADGVYQGPRNRNINFGGKKITVRSENGPQFTTIDAQRNGSVFIFNTGETEDSVVEGFTIRGGNQSGIRITAASPTIRDCIIVDNWNGGLGGGGVYVEGAGHPTIIDSVMDQNLASQGGGILLWQGGQATLIRCIISGNRVDITGGGAAMADLGSQLFMEACIVRGNQSVGFAGSSAGVRIARDSTGIIVNSLFHSNIAQGPGAGVSVTNNGAGKVLNCIIANNQAVGSGGGMLLTQVSAGVVNASVANTILWGNIPDQISHQGGNLGVFHSLVQGGWQGTGNIMDDPQFIDPAGGDYRPGSLAVVDAGDNNALPQHISTDLAGNPRFVDTPGVPNTGVPGGVGGSAIVDIGAYEAQGGCYPNCDGSTTEPILNIDDFTCFVAEFAAAQTLPHAQQIAHYTNCDGSTVSPVLNIDDFVCFVTAFAAGCR